MLAAPPLAQFGLCVCHPERREGSEPDNSGYWIKSSDRMIAGGGLHKSQILRCAQDDKAECTHKNTWLKKQQASPVGEACNN